MRRGARSSTDELTWAKGSSEGKQSRPPAFEFQDSVDPINLASGSGGTWVPLAVWPGSVAG